VADSVWRWSPECDQPILGVVAGGVLPALAWAEEIRPQLLALQRDTGLPALGVVSQWLHEAWNPGGWTMSRLAKEFNNYGGLKWANWQREFGGRPVSMSTWEEINGERVDLDDAFCAFPSFSAFVLAYASLMTGTRYGQARQYAADPFLWVRRIWGAGYATDSRYLVGVGEWMAAIWSVYAGTFQPVVTVGRSVDVVDSGGTLLSNGWLMDPDGPGPEGDRVVVRLRDFAEAQGLIVDYEHREPVPLVRVGFPGQAQLPK
jgi:hypothetical protein